MNIRPPEKIYEEVVNKPELTKMLNHYLVELESQIRQAIIQRRTETQILINYSSLNQSFLSAPEMAKILVLNIIQVIEPRGYRPKFRVSGTCITLYVSFPNIYGIEGFDEKLKKYMCTTSR
jgi:hypothetical protein